MPFFFRYVKFPHFFSLLFFYCIFTCFLQFFHVFSLCMQAFPLAFLAFSYYSMHFSRKVYLLFVTLHIINKILATSEQKCAKQLSCSNLLICIAFVTCASNAITLFSSLRTMHCRTKCFSLYRNFLYNPKKRAASIRSS